MVIKKLLCKFFPKYFYIYRHLKNKTIHNIDSLRTAYRNNDVEAFRYLLMQRDTHIQDDKMVECLTEDLMKVIALKTIEGMIGSYKRVTVQYLMDELSEPQDVVERYLAELIISGKIRGKINQAHNKGKGYFENEDLTVDHS